MADKLNAGQAIDQDWRRATLEDLIEDKDNF